MSWSTGKASARIAVLLAVLAAGAAMLWMRRRDEIAERAGISPRSLFRYFEDADDLVDDLKRAFKVAEKAA